MSEINGWYYLHTNGSMIYKPSPDAIVDIRDSDFAVCAWPVDSSSRLDAWCILVEGAALGAKPERIAELRRSWSCTEKDADKFAEYAGFTIENEGDQFCAYRTDFVNLQESPAGFGQTKFDACVALAKALGVSGGTMWRATFLDLIKVG